MAFHRKLRELDLHGPAQERVINDSGAIITAMKVVKFTGHDSTTDLPKIEVISSLSDCARGILREDTADGQEGLVAGYSIFLKVDTSSYSLGQKLFSTATGDLVTVSSPLFIAQVIKVGTTDGVLFVKPETVESVGMVDSEEVSSVNLLANTPLNVNSTILTKITSVEVIDSANLRITGALKIDIQDAPVRVTLLSLVSLNNLKVRLTGDT